MILNKDISVLIVDDTTIMHHLITKILKAIGYQNIVTAVDGLDAIETLKEQKVDLIISDWNMPNMDGLQFLKWVRQEEAFKDIPFIMATAQADKSQETLALQEGANTHIAKPFDEENLKAKIEEAFGLKQETEEEARPKVKVKGKVPMEIAHIQITDHLALGILKHQIATGEVSPQYFDLQTTCMPGWNPVQEALEKGRVDAAFVLAPIAMDLFGFGAKIKLILLAHKNGSVFVHTTKTPYDDFGSNQAFFKNRSVNIPHKMSIHHMLAHKFLTKQGLTPGVPGPKKIDVRFEVVPPIQMPAIMKDNAEVAGFIVAEPIGSSAIANGIAELTFKSAQVWPNHPCCVVAFQDDFIARFPDAVHEFTSLLVQAGKFVERHKIQAAEIAVAFLDPQQKLGLQKQVLLSVLDDSFGIKMNNLLPVLDDLEAIQRYMHEQMGIGKLIDLEKFVDLQFAKAVYG
jgi:CheY-like chemotaxis protein/ABC-type nitrate/sulfonate/bicarbonate transport system substrate-binding protein